MTVHHEVLRAQLNKYKGVEMQSDGDAVLLGFRDPVSAIAWCLATQQVHIIAGALSALVFGMKAPLAPVVNARCHADKLIVYAQAKALISLLTSQLAALTPSCLNRLC
jgi:class 3 adenylate cyclase